jgi:hypothetical protein
MGRHIPPEAHAALSVMAGLVPAIHAAQLRFRPIPSFSGGLTT